MVDIQKFVQKWPFPRPTSIEVGLSGGLDSVVLLHVLHTVRQYLPFTLSAVHVHHGLSPNADKWADFCRQLCTAWDIQYRIEHVTVVNHGAGIEASAREQRYKVFSDGISDILALAHHQNDQIETFMLAALRGGGLRALASMPVWRPLNQQTTIWRPLLEYSRFDLEQYAIQHKLEYVEDESNQDTNYLRNWLRHEALPTWSEAIPYLNQQIVSSIHSLQEDLQLLDDVVKQDKEQICSNGYFDLNKWRTLGELRQRHQLLRFAQDQQLGTPRKHSIVDFCRVLNEISSGSACWELPKGSVYAYQNRLFAVTKSDKHYPWQAESTGRLKDILLQQGFELIPQSFGLPLDIFEQQGVIRCFQAGDTLSTSVGNKQIKKILQECHIPPFMRNKWPIILNEKGESLSVANLRASKDFCIAGGVLPVHQKLSKFITELNHKIKV